MASSLRTVWLCLAIDLLVWSAASAARQQPSINLTSADDGLVWGPDGARIARGHSFSFTCSVGSGLPPGRFRLVFSGSNETLAEPAVNDVASFHFPAADYHHQGNYSCLYEDTVSPQNFSPVKTEPIVVVITAAVPLWVLASSIAGGTLMVLLLVLMGVALICRIRRSLDIPKAIVQTQPTATGSFQENDCDEEEEDDYMNIDQEDSQLNQRQHAPRADSEEEDDDEYMNFDQEDSGMNQRRHAPRPDSDGQDGGHGHENEDFQDNYVVAMELRSVSARGEAEDEDEEGSGDENDYVNVSNFVTEQAVGDMQDIYENL